MSALNVIEKISNTNLLSLNLKYCLVDNNKLPHKIDNSLAKPNDVNDFIDLETLLQCNDLENYIGVGISIQASNICAIDVDHCFSKPNDITSINNIGKEVLNLFKDCTYSEFSFSGTGLRIIFKTNNINNYTSTYYIKNAKNQIEYYQPTKSYRYVTITGNVIYDNLSNDYKYIYENVIEFLDKYMKKPERKVVETNIIKDEKSIKELMIDVKRLYIKNINFQTLWFKTAPGSGKNESELDYQLMAYLYENITQDKDKLKKIFEESPYYKSKDWKHINKWKNQDGRYYNYVYEQIRRTHKCLL